MYGFSNHLEFIGTACFFLSILHTFLVSLFRRWARRYPEGSVLENVFHFLGEVEVVFGLWAAIFLGFVFASIGSSSAIEFLNRQSFAEPLFVFVIMSVCSTKPIVAFAKVVIYRLASFIPILSKSSARYFVTLTLGPLLGSFITEPAAMTVTAFILLEEFFSKEVSHRFRYLSLGVLFVNVSIGGVLTPYAAPPVLMVATKWAWDLSFMMNHFAWKATLGVILNSMIGLWMLRAEFSKLKPRATEALGMPFWIIGIHLVFLIGLVSVHQVPVLVVGIFLFFLGFYQISGEYQTEIKLKESLLVAFFLAGLVILGSVQSWWLQPLLSGLNSLQLYLGSIGLTSVTDNAALTYLGSQVADISESFKYLLVAGAVVGGGVTVIANAPNPAGYSILQGTFGSRGINPLKLALAALIPTLVAGLIFWVQ
jgi:hypothetical protein